MKPGQPISRQEAAAITARICKLDTSSDLAAVNKFTASETMPVWSKGASLNIADKVKVSTMTLNAAVSITGQGTIETARITVAGTTIQQTPTVIENPNNVVISTGTNSGSNTGSGTGTGSGGGNAPLNLVSSDPADNSTGVSATPIIMLTFDRGVVRDHWDTNQNCIVMKNSGSQTVSIDVYRAPNYLDDSEKRNIYISPVGSLNAGTTYTITISGNLTANNDRTLGQSISLSFTVAGGGGGSDSGNVPATPVYINSEVTTNGDVSVLFSKDMEPTATLSGKEGQFSVLVDGMPDVVTGLSRTGTTTKIKLTLTTKITGGQIVSVAYAKGADTAGQVITADGGVLESFEAQTVLNGLGPAAPVLVADGAEVTTKGDISLIFDKPVDVPDKDLPYPDNMAEICAQFTVQVNNHSKAITAVITTSTPGKIKLVVADPKITSGDDVYVTYVRDGITNQIKAVDGGILDNFGPQAVINNL